MEEDVAERFQEAFEAACARRDRAVWRRSHRFAGRRADIVVAGSELAAVVGSAFAHVAVESADAAPAELRIEAWDERETGVAAPLRLEGAWWSPDRRLVAYGSPAWTGVYDRHARRLVAAVRARADVTHAERARPFGPLVVVWYADRGYRILHAGLVIERGGGIVLAGGNRAGKSTAVYACLRAGMTALGDDVVAIAPRPDGSFAVHAVFGTLLVDRDMLRAGGGFVRPEPDDERGRQLIWVETRAPDAATVVSLVFPCVTPDTRSALEPLRRGEALRMLLPHAAYRLTTGERDGFDTLTALVDRVQCHRLQAGSDLRGLAETIGGAVAPGSTRCAS